MKFIFVVILVICHGCNSSKMPAKMNRIESGSLLFHVKQLDNSELVNKEQFLIEPKKVWYNDSCVIMEINVLRNEFVDGVKGKSSSFLIKYIFLDLRTMNFLDYKNFHDTSQPFQRYTAPIDKVVNWNFYRYNNWFNLHHQLKDMPDTSINGLVYKRKEAKSMGYDEKAKGGYKFTYYVKCDVPATLFHIDRKFDEMNNNCPAVRVDFQTSEKINIIISTSYKFVKDSLTKFEQNIFKAWRKNALQTNLPLKDSADEVDY